MVAKNEEYLPPFFSLREIEYPEYVTQKGYWDTGQDGPRADDCGGGRGGCAVLGRKHK